MNRDFLLINKLQLLCRIGTTPEERASAQPISVSIRCELSLMKAGRSDDLNNSVDYAKIIEDVRTISQEKIFNLIESLADTIAQIVLSHPLIEATEITVDKKPFKDVESVSASIRREK